MNDNVSLDLRTLRRYVGSVRPILADGSLGDAYRVRSPSALAWQQIERIQTGQVKKLEEILATARMLVPTMPLELLNDMGLEELMGIVLMSANPTIAAEHLAQEALDQIDPKGETGTMPVSPPSTPLATSATASPRPPAAIGGGL